MQFFAKKAKSKGRVGLIVNPTSLALVHIIEKEGAPYLLQAERVALESEREAGKALTDLVKDMDLEGTQCSYVLTPKNYNLHLVEAPNVEEDELRAAVRWKIKDLLDMKVEDAAIDVFPVPEDAYRGRKMVYVVAAVKSRIQSIVEMVTEAKLELAVIDIPELAMKNLSERFIQDAQGVAFMDLRRTGSTMNITHGGDLYLTRRINTQLDPDVMDSQEWPSLKDRLVLEIQRSLDYYESQLGRGQISRVVIAQRQHDTGGMARALDELLTAQVMSLNLADHLQSEVPLTPELQQLAMAPIGACLRGMKIPEAPVLPDPAEQEAA